MLGRQWAIAAGLVSLTLWVTSARLADSGQAGSQAGERVTVETERVRASVRLPRGHRAVALVIEGPTGRYAIELGGGEWRP